MPVQTSAPTLPDSFPSFMSVFGGRTLDFPEKEARNTALKPLRLPTNVTINTSTRRPFPFQHRASISSVTSGSADSSPTTTISTFDSPSVADTSPSSSPESPSSMPLAFNNKITMPPARNFESQSSSTNSLSQPASDGASLPRPDSPGRRARNLKNLSLRMPPPSQSRPPIATASMVEGTSHHVSAPPSPAHVPLKGMRRKPANLTIRTPGFDRSFSNNITELVPPTPHSLRHTESSPSLTSVFSPSFGPKGGMQLPRPMTHHGARRPSATSESNLSPLQTVEDEDSASGGVLHELKEEDDHLDSRESTRRSERGYPNGPIQIYDTGVFLYLEPTAQEASQFDVVVNVAKEVANPFTKASASTETVVSALRNGSVSPKRLPIAEPWTAASETSFKSALEYPPSRASLPATPKNEAPGPEYVHVGWDHNSEILEDLYPLCQLIDSRIADGKKVLVHCQLGASRSASLVIAYGLFKNRDLDFNSMYEIVKERSRWVGPNMSLIYQLTDFRSRLLSGGLSKAAPEEWFGESSPKLTEQRRSRADKRESGEACIPGNESVYSDFEPHSSNAMSQASMSSLSAPSTNQTTPVSIESLGFTKSLSRKRSISPRPLPLRQSFHTGLTSDITPAKSAPPAWHSEAGPYSLAKTDMFVREGSEESNALFSPRTTDFMAAPISRSVSDVLEDDGLNGLRFRSRIADPRSPPPGNERLIMRNIDEFL